MSVDEIMDLDHTTFNQLNPKTYGIIVRSGMVTGLILPDLEGVDTVKEQVDISIKKAGISKNVK